MIVSHAHKFIYIKTYKTASTSMEVALARICGPDDVITPTRLDLQAHREEARAQNYRLSHPLVPKRPLIKRLLRRPERYYHPSVGFYEHMPAVRVRDYVDPGIWKRYFKFTFERNPWDRQISWYHYKVVDKNQSTSFADFMADRKRAYVTNFDLYSEFGAILMDFIGRYESVETDFAEVLRQIGAEGQTALPHVNKSERGDDYRAKYTPETRSIVADWYRREIEHFGYEF